jgi:hypothetical protein
MAGAAAFIVVLIVAVGDGEDPSIKMAAKTTHDALEGDAIVVVREVESERLSSDDEATKLVGVLNASAIAVLTWRDPQHRTVFVHARSERRPEWVDRSLVFAESDPMAERGRTIGFEVASIISVLDGNAKAAAKKDEPPPPSKPPKDGGGDKAGRFSLDIVGTAAAGKGAGGLGGDLSGRFWFFDRRIAAHLGAGARAGETLAEAGASILVARLAAGIGARFVSHQLFDVGARLDGVALWHRLSGSNGSNGSFLAPGLMGLVEGSWRFAQPFAVVAAAGAEVAFGSIRVFVDDQARATIQPARGVAEVGLRWEP